MVFKRNVHLILVLFFSDTHFLDAPPKQNPKGKQVKEVVKGQAKAKGDRDDALLDAVLDSPGHRKALELASKKEELEKAQVKAKAKEKELDVQRKSLLRAFASDDIQGLQALIIQSPDILSGQLNQFGDTPLMITLQNISNFKNKKNLEMEDGYKNIFNQLLRADIDLNMLNKKRETALYFAVFLKNKEAVRMLLAARANPNLQTIHGFSALMVALSEGSLDLAEMLLDAGADPNLSAANGLTALKIIEDLDVTRMLLAAGADPNMPNDKGVTPLMNAISSKNLELVKMFIHSVITFNKKADLNKQDLSTGLTAILIAIAEIGRYKENEEVLEIIKKIIEELLNAGVDVNVEDNFGFNPLMHVVDQGSGEIVEMLLCAGADPNLQTRSLSTALMIAILREDVGMVKKLLDAGGNPNMRSRDGVGVYAYTNFLTEPKRSEIKKLLKDNGENLESKDIESLALMQLAEDEKKEEERLRQEEALKVQQEKEVEQELIKKELKALAEEKIESRKAELLKKQKERRKQREAALQRKEQEKQKQFLKTQAERAAQKEQEKQIEIRRVQDLIRVISQDGYGYSSKENLEDIRAALNRIAIYIPVEIKERCSSVRKLFNRYEASINIDHIIHIESQFKKLPREDKYKIIFSGGHYEQSIQNLIAYGFVTSKNRVVLPNGCIRYTLINNFDESEFVKTVFPGDMAIDQITELIIGSSVLEESQEKDLMAGNIIILIAEKNGIRTKNVLKVDFFTKNLTLVSSYPL